MNNVQVTISEAPKAFKALRARKFQDPLVGTPIKITPIKIYA